MLNARSVKPFSTFAWKEGFRTRYSHCHSLSLSFDWAGGRVPSAEIDSGKVALRSFDLPQGLMLL